MHEMTLLVAASLGMVLAACKKQGAQSIESQGDELFAANCARCHGVSGEGMKFAAPPGGGPVPPRNLTDPAFQSVRTDAEIKSVIVGGKGAMPPFGKLFSDQELDALVRKVRRFK